ncbi:MAG: lysostaphin resistance A-like protein [Candidatus Dormibacteria bacterium]
MAASSVDVAQLIELALALITFSFILVAANLGDSSSAWRIVAFSGEVGLCAVVAALAVLNIITVLVIPASVQATTGLPASRVIGGNLLQLAGALAAPLVMLPAIRRQVGRLLRDFRPESAINAVGASMYVLVVTLFLSLQFSTDQLKQIKQSGESPSLLYIISTNQLPFLIVGIVGVGLFVRRSPGEALKRLGLVWPGWRWIGAGALVAVLLVFFGIAFDQLITKLTPDQSKSINEASQQLLANVTSPLAAVALALAAGIGEEVLFRGAIQPRLGIVAAALMFAVLHTQYAISLASLEIFILGIALGWLRQRGSTTAAIIAHSGYDLILLMIPFVLHH